MNNSINFVASKLNVSSSQVKTVLDFIKEGSTVPFIARYRQEATGGLDEKVIEKINDIYVYDTELNKRKEAVLNLLKEKELLTEELKSKIDATTTKSNLEAIYEPFKVGKKTKASAAIELGLEPLALSIMNASDSFDLSDEVSKYINDKVKDSKFAIEQTEFIIAQLISQDIKTREYVKTAISSKGSLTSSKKKKAEDPKEKFKQYYAAKELVGKIPNHRVMALARGEDLKILSIGWDIDESKIDFDLGQKYVKSNSTEQIMKNSLADSLKRLIYPSLKRSIRAELFDRAQKDSIKLFAKNLESMLLAPSIKGKTIIAIDPAFVSGCKIAVLNPSGDVLKIDIIKPTPPRRDIEGSTIVLNKLIDKFKANIIVIGNGTASRETEAFVAKVLKNRGDQIPFAIVSEVGASVYSASKIAIEEFPDLSVEQRSAINIGRRFQDPLNELVKVDPKSIGVGQYQHDVNQKELANSLATKVMLVVNQVGVDLNTATKEILSYISGLSAKVANNVVLHRREFGLFENRRQLKKVKGLGPKAYEQAVGFMRIHESKTFYDKTQIHPESYKLANEIVKTLKLDLKAIDKSILDNANAVQLAQQHDSNKYDVQLILDSLKAPGKDIRDSRDGPLLKTDVLDMKDLKEGMELEGTVQNITDFGAFVYIGLKQAALIHISKLSSGFVKHPSDIVSTGEKVTVEILEVDQQRERIQAKLIRN